MSSHETIRVLEVEVDAAVPSPGTYVKTEAGAEEVRGKALESAEGGTQDRKTASSTIPTGRAIIAYMQFVPFYSVIWSQLCSVLNISCVNLYSY